MFPTYKLKSIKPSSFFHHFTQMGEHPPLLSMVQSFFFFFFKEVHAVIELVPYLEGINSLENILWLPCRTKENFAFLHYFSAFL